MSTATPILPKLEPAPESAPRKSGAAVACADPQLSASPRPIDIWDLRVLKSYLATADHGLDRVLYAAEGIADVEVRVEEVRVQIREAAMEIESLSALVQAAAEERARLKTKRGRR